MTPAEALAHYGSQAAIARACEVSDSAVHQWFKQGFIPHPRQCELQIESGGSVIARRQDAQPHGFLPEGPSAANVPVAALPE